MAYRKHSGRSSPSRSHKSNRGHGTHSKRISHLGTSNKHHSPSSKSSSSSNPSLQTRVNNSGYKQYKKPTSGTGDFTHRRVAEKKLHGRICVTMEYLRISRRGM